MAQSRVTNHLLPSYSHHLNCWGEAPPVTEAVKVIDVPVGCGALSVAVRLEMARAAVGAGAGAANVAGDAALTEFVVELAVAATMVHVKERDDERTPSITVTVTV